MIVFATWGAAQWIYIALMALGLIICANKHGQSGTPYNINASLLSASITLGLLVWGGFFS